MEKVDFQYYVAYVNDVNLHDKFNLGPTKKVIPGRPISVPKDVSNWMDNKIEVQVGTQVFQEKISKIQMDFSGKIERDIEVYKKEFSIA